MERGRIGLAAGLSAIAAAALVSAGCGSGGALSLDPVASAATKTQNAGAVHVKYAMTMSAAGKSFALDGNGVIDGTNADVTFDLGSMLSRLGSSAGAFGGATPSEIAHASMEEVILKQGSDVVIYLRLPSFMATEIPGGKQWMEMDLSKLGSLHGVDLSKLFSGSQVNPSDMLAILKSESSKVETVGTETIDGVSTTHYSVTIDTAKAYAQKGLTSPLFTQITAKMPTLPVDVWVDKNNLVRRESLAMSVPASGESVSMRMTIDFSDYGASATVVAPPSSDVFDATSLVSSGFGSGSGG